MAPPERPGDELPFGPARLIISRTKYLLRHGDRDPLAVPARCAPILESLVRNFDKEVPLEELEKVRPGKTSLIQTIADIRNLLDKIGIPREVIDIPTGREGEGYILRDRQKAKPQNISGISVPGSTDPRGDEREPQPAGSDNVGAQLEVFNAYLSRSSAIRVFPRWSDADIAVINARSAVTIIDSYYDEHTRLEWLLGAMRNHDCVVSIYMATPDMDFGTQRRKEWDILEDDDYSEVRRKLATIISDRERADYEHDFHKVCDDIMRCAKKEHIKRKGIKCELFEYPVMLSLRFIVIDGTDIIWGFYPLFDTNPNYPCLCLSWADDLNEADKSLFNKLSLQVKHIKEISVPKVARENRSRHNYHSNICDKMATSDHA